MGEQERSNQLRSGRYGWASDDQWSCILFLFDFELGEHHLRGTIKPWGDGVQYNRLVSGDLCTFDVDGLTRLVFLAHDRCIRVEVAASSPKRVHIACHKRHSRTAEKRYARHPALETALIRWRAIYPVHTTVGGTEVLPGDDE